MGRYKKWILGIVVFFVLFTVIGFFVVPPILKSYLLETLSKTLNRQVSLSDISLNPYTLTLTLRGFEIKEPQGEKTFVRLTSAWSIWTSDPCTGGLPSSRNSSSASPIFTWSGTGTRHTTSPTCFPC